MALLLFKAADRKMNHFMMEDNGFYQYGKFAFLTRYWDRRTDGSGVGEIIQGEQVGEEE